MDLSTTYLGLDLPHPFMVGASPLVDDLDTAKRLEDAGTAAIVMRSLFEEQITREGFGTLHRMEELADSHAEAVSFFPAPSDYALGPDRYLEQIRRLKNTVSVPVIASLNGTTDDGWTWYARLVEEAGADALELNIYQVVTDPLVSADSIESRVIAIARATRRAVRIPVAVKLSPFYTSLANLAHRLEREGMNGLILFNRFYQPDLDVNALDVVPDLHLSDSSELLLRLRWLAILQGSIETSLAVSGGVHTTFDALKAVMAGADAVQMVSAVLRHGPKLLTAIREGVAVWLEEHEYESLAEAKGSLSLSRCPDPAAFERGNYMRVLQSWRSSHDPLVS